MIRIIYVLIILLVVLWGCKKDYTMGIIDSDIEIKMWETVDSTSRTLQFHCSTEKIYNCSNYGISKTFRKISDKIDIDFNGILFYDMCFTSFGPATTIIDLGTLSNGTYKLNINVGHKKTEGQLSVTSDYYAITLNNEKQLKINNTPLQRIPTKAIWGTVGYHTSSTEALVQTFIDSLQFLGAATNTYPSGEYGYFEINSSGQILPPDNHGYYLVIPFIFDFAGNTSDLKKLVKNYETNYGDSLSIRLYTTKGEMLSSWIQ